MLGQEHLSDFLRVGGQCQLIQRLTDIGCLKLLSSWFSSQDERPIASDRRNCIHSVLLGQLQPGSQIADRYFTTHPRAPWRYHTQKLEFLRPPAWLDIEWLAEGVKPDRWDLLGATICLVGAVVIMFAPHWTTF